MNLESENKIYIKYFFFTFFGRAAPFNSKKKTLLILTKIR